MFTASRMNYRLILLIMAVMFPALGAGCGSNGGDDGLALIEQESSQLAGMNIYFGNLNGHSNTEGV